MPSSAAPISPLRLDQQKKCFFAFFCREITARHRLTNVPSPHKQQTDVPQTQRCHL